MRARYEIYLCLLYTSSAMKVMNVSVPYYNLFSLLPFALKISPITNVKMFGGTVKRIRNGKIK